MDLSTYPCIKIDISKNICDHIQDFYFIPTLSWFYIDYIIFLFILISISLFQLIFNFQIYTNYVSK